MPSAIAARSLKRSRQRVGMRRGTIHRFADRVAAFDPLRAGHPSRRPVRRRRTTSAARIAARWRAAVGQTPPRRPRATRKHSPRTTAESRRRF